jgi:hypothetical protein
MEQAQWAVYSRLTAAPFNALLTRADYRLVRALINADAAGECIWANDLRAALRYYGRALMACPHDGRYWKAALTVGVKLIAGLGQLNPSRAFSQDRS